MPVMGDLLQPGSWQDQVSTDWVFHVPPHVVPERRMGARRAAAMGRARLRMDAHLLDAVAAGVTRRIVYVTETTCYTATGGPGPITEDALLQPSAWGRHLMPALEQIEGYVMAGHPIVSAITGCVYGNGGWFRHRVIEPVLSGRRVLVFGKTGPWLSPIHVKDSARALIHLAEHGASGGRYFVANHDPIRLEEFAVEFARLAHRHLRVWRIPAVLAPLVVGPALAACWQNDAVFSNIRLRGLGFRFLYGTLDQGLRQILGALDE
jgi:nucleoside-diphosphate-sugar epimerase